MEHLSEQNIEQYVLRGSGAGPSRKQVEAHLKVCAGCRDLVDQASSFYEELRSELEAHPAAGPPASQSLARRPRRAPALFQSPFKEAHLSPVLPGGILRRLIWNHPIAVGGSGLAFIAAGLVLAMNLTRTSVTDLNPTSYLLNRHKGCLEVFNKSGDLLLTRPVPRLDQYISEQENLVATCVILADLDGDGTNEILTTLPIFPRDMERGEVLHILKHDGALIRDLEPGEALTCRNRLYPDEFRVDWFTVGDFSGSGKNEIILVANDLHSPAMVSRFDASGRRIGTYRHFGQMVGMMGALPLMDGRKEIVLHGASDRNEGEQTAVVVALDPSLLVGDGESSYSGGFGLPASRAEQFYVRILQTEVARECGIPVFVRAARPVMLTGNQPGFRILSTGERDSLTVYFEYIFRADFTIAEVKSENATKREFDRLASRAGIAGDFFDDYMRKVAREIRYWDGHAWQSSPVSVRH